MNWKSRLALLALGGYIVAQGIGNLNAHHYVYWNISRKVILYPETQIIAGGSLVLLSLVPLGWLMQRLTAPFFKQRHPLLKPIWKRRHQDHFNNPE